MVRGFLVGAALLALPAPATAFVTLGAPLTGTLGNSPCATGPTCTHTTLVAPADRILAAPFPGVITSWSYRVQNSANGNFATLRVIRPAAGTSFFGVRTSEPVPVPNPSNSGVNTSAARVPIAAGDHIAIDLPVSLSVYAAVPPGVTKDGWSPALANGETRNPTGIAGGGSEVQVQAREEPDADTDGFGDETQDLCPTNALIQSACPAELPAPAAPIATVTPDTRPPVTVVAVSGKKPSLASVLRSGILLAVSSDEPGTFDAEASARLRSGKLAAAPGAVVLAQATGGVRTGTNAVKLKLGSKAKKLVKASKKLSLSLSVTVRDTAKNATVKTARLSLR